MMRKYVLIGCFGVALILGACAGNSPSPPGGEAASSAAPSKFDPSWSDSGKIPDWSLELARKKFLGVLYPKDVEEAKAHLRSLVLEKSPRFMAETRAYMVKNDWNSEFIHEFDKIVAWHRRLLTGDPKKVYEEAHVFLSKGLSKGGFKTNEYIGEQLLFAAGAGGYFKGLLEYARRHLDVKSENFRSTGRYWLRETADLGFVPAQLDIAERYLDGRGFGQSRAKALYWLGRAAMEGEDVRERIQSLKKEISPDEYVQIMKWTSRKFPPRD